MTVLRSISQFPQRVQHWVMSGLIRLTWLCIILTYLGFAYPPQNANGIRNVLQAMLDQTRYPTPNDTPYIDFFTSENSDDDRIGDNQMVFEIREDRPGAVDTDTFLGETTFHGYEFSVSVFNDGDTDHPGVWPTPGTPAVPAHDSEHIIIDQPIPEFGTTEQGNRTFDPGLVPTPDLLQRTANHFLSGLGNVGA